MKLKHVVSMTVMGLVFATTCAAEEVNCIGVKTDATFGAQLARDGVPKLSAVGMIEKSAQNIDEQLVKAKRKRMTPEMKDKMKQSFVAGYEEAIKHPEDTIEQVAGRVVLACYFKG